MNTLTAARRAAPALVAVVALWAIGCGPSTGTISGVVTLNGNPARDITISFLCPDGSVYTAMVDSDGKYSVDNVPVGPVKVTIQSPPPVSEGTQESIKKGKAPAPKAGKVPVNPKYTDPANSGLSLTVKPGANPFDIPLTS
jgi:hypothetical protein